MPDETIHREEDEDESLPPSWSIAFLHAVGQSTLQQGLTVPVIAQVGWLCAVAKGESVPVTIRFAGDQTAPARLRRLNNARGHLQFRYETKQQAHLRDYLTSAIRKGTNCKNAVLQVMEVEPRVFSFELIGGGVDHPAVLSLCKPHFHHCRREEIEERHEFDELNQCLAKVAYDENANQSEYNKQLANTLHAMGWSNETRILGEIGLRCDFQKNDVWVEVEFGNARVYYQDYIKFLMATRFRQAKLGVLICPTNAFAQLLCDLGQRRAAARRKEQDKRRPSYSGMMSYEKAMRELPFLEFMLTSPLVIAGIEIARE